MQGAEGRCGGGDEVAREGRTWAVCEAGLVGLVVVGGMKNVKNVIWLGVMAIVLGCSAFAAAPDDVTGMIYDERTELQAAGDARGSFRRKILLERDGRAVGLFSVSASGFTGFRPVLRIPANGRWNYRRLSETQAELTLDERVIGLTFTGERTGRASGTTMLSVVTFALVPYEAGNPLTNSSYRSFVPAGGRVFTGFVLTSAVRNRVLIRAVGPGLSQFGVGNPLREPVLTVLNARGETVGTNAGWSNDAGVAEASARAGAFPLAGGSSDAALLDELAPGAYTAQVTSRDANAAGEVLFEVYLLP